MSYQLDIQIATSAATLPSAVLFQTWVDAALAGYSTPFEVLIRLVDEPEMSTLNETYRHKQGPTNVLSFPFEAPPGVELNLLGDLVLCAPVIAREAAQQNKSLEHHWAHMVIHGIFHLLGYDHIDEQEAEEMEALEIDILKTLHINNPYKEI